MWRSWPRKPAQLGGGRVTCWLSKVFLSSYQTGYISALLIYSIILSHSPSYRWHDLGGELSNILIYVVAHSLYKLLAHSVVCNLIYNWLYQAKVIFWPCVFQSLDHDLVPFVLFFQAKVTILSPPPTNSLLISKTHLSMCPDNTGGTVQAIDSELRTLPWPLVVISHLCAVAAGSPILKSLKKGSCSHWHFTDVSAAHAGLMNKTHMGIEMQSSTKHYQQNETENAT